MLLTEWLFKWTTLTSRTNWSKLRIYWRWITPNWVTRDNSISNGASRVTERVDPMWSINIVLYIYIYMWGGRRCRETSDLLDQPHCCILDGRLLFFSLLYLCVREMSPPRAWVLRSRDSHSARRDRLSWTTTVYTPLFAPGPLYIYGSQISAAAASASPHSGMQRRCLGWLGVFPTCMQQQPQIESLKREFIMQPANKNAQGYQISSTITTWRRLASLVCFSA